MRIIDPEPAPGDASVNTDAAQSSANASQDKASTFSRLLEKKREANQESAQAKASKHKPGGLPAPVDPQMEGQSRFDQTISATQVEGGTTVGLPPELQQLVREISVLVQQSGKQQVQIELNSTVLKGLNIRIEKQNEAIAIQFQSTSDEIRRMLSKNIDSLAQGLADRGVAVADIGISGPLQSAEGTSYKSRSNLAGRWQRERPAGRQ